MTFLFQVYSNEELEELVDETVEITFKNFQEPDSVAESFRNFLADFFYVSENKVTYKGVRLS